MTTEVTENRSEEPPATEESNNQKSKDSAERTGTENGTATASAAANAAENENDGDEGEDNHDPFYPPIVSLPLVEVPTGENGEVEVFKRRAKLYR